MKIPNTIGRRPGWATLALILVSLLIEAASNPVTLLNVSYDPTREFYQD